MEYEPEFCIATCVAIANFQPLKNAFIIKKSCKQEMKNKTITKSTPENFIRLETFLWHMCHIISMGISKIIKYILSSLFTEKEQVPLE